MAMEPCQAESSKSGAVQSPGRLRPSITSGMELHAPGEGWYSVSALDFQSGPLRRISLPSLSNKIVRPGRWRMMRPLVAPA